MSDQPSVRAAEPGDAERIREVVESSMTATYALSPQDIETLVETEFSEDAQQRFQDDDTIAFVAEVDDDEAGDDAAEDEVLAGFVEASVSADQGEGTVRWLHVDPERRGGGVGTTLFERTLSELDERGVDGVRALDLADNTSPGAFFERFDFAMTDEREVDVGGLETVEYVYVEEATGDDSAGERTAADDADSPTDEGDAEEGPDLDTSDLPDSVTTDDGEDVFLGDELLQGSEGGFVTTFVDDDRSEQYGYYCLNCESTDVSMDSMERIKCGNCGNTRKPDEEYDDSYL